MLELAEDRRVWKSLPLVETRFRRRRSLVKVIAWSMRPSTKSKVLVMSSLTPYQMSIVKLALQLRYYQHTIASYFGVNQGRISEFKNSPMFVAIAPAPVLPVGFPSRP